MILGIGTDIVRIARLEEALARHGRRFAERVLAPAELAELDTSGQPARLLAKRFAAKEAAVKALGTGVREGIALAQIAVTHDALGKPGLAWEGAARARLEALGATGALLTLSDEKEYALAFVVLLGR